MTQATAVEVHGFCDPQFGAVRERFAANFEQGLEVGASFAAEVGGRLVVDLWAGHADQGKSRPWREDTIVNVFSTTKAMATICAHILADRGLLDFDAPVAKYWPEFAWNGKASVPMRWLISHQAGVPGITGSFPPEVVYDWDLYTSALAEESPWWEPGTANGYHALSFGHLVGEVVRRIDGRSLGTFFRQEVAEPLNADFHIGFGPALDARVGEMIQPDEQPTGELPPESLIMRVFNSPPMPPNAVNTRAWRAAEIPAGNGHGNARSCARIMSALALGGERDGVRLMSRETIERAIKEQCYRPDLVLGMRMRWALGFMLSGAELPLGPNPNTFGHGGAGGSLAVADLDAGVAWAYVMNRMVTTTTGDLRGIGLQKALYGAL